MGVLPTGWDYFRPVLSILREVMITGTSHTLESKPYWKTTESISGTRVATRISITNLKATLRFNDDIHKMRIIRCNQETNIIKITK
jgi:phosphodiesterase/alkaline phosphatase D-like protein